MPHVAYRAEKLVDIPLAPAEAAHSIVLVMGKLRVPSLQDLPSGAGHHGKPEIAQDEVRQEVGQIVVIIMIITCLGPRHKHVPRVQIAVKHGLFAGRVHELERLADVSNAPRDYRNGPGLISAVRVGIILEEVGEAAAIAKRPEAHSRRGEAAC
jgi:hypothetical protein